MRLRRRLPLVIALAGCNSWHSVPLPSPRSAALMGSGTFRAGFAAIDITPPPGLGLAGSGPEGRDSRGYRTRLYARAMVVEDASGERMGFVVLDLPHVSTNLHRLAAARLAPVTGLGADRLILSATHTHSSYGHFYAERQYNANATRTAGYDPRVADLIVGRIDSVVRVAAARLAPAKAAWGETSIVGATWNRSLEAFCRNPEQGVNPGCRLAAHQPGRGDIPEAALQAVDSVLVMLRVDQVLEAGRTRPLGSLNVFAIHGTAVPATNRLLDGDVHGRIMRRMGQLIGKGSEPTVHLFANGAEGDVAPVVRRDPACDVPRVGSLDPFPMPRGPTPIADFVEPDEAAIARCMRTARVEMDTLALRIADRAVRLFQELEPRLRDDLVVRRTFAVARLPGVDGLCEHPVIGASAAAGAEGAETRIRGWRWLLWPVFVLGYEEGGRAIRPREGACQSPKRELLTGLQRPLVVGEHGFPAAVQLSLVRIGDGVLAASPGEVTTTAGRRILDAVSNELGRRGERPATVALIGLANGFIQYVTTAEEYGAQSYEGGSNLYGPGTAAFLLRRFVELAEGLPGSSAPSPVADVAPITAHPGPPSRIMAPADAGPIVEPKVLRSTCDNGRLEIEWRDQSAGRLFPRSTPLIGIVRVWDGSVVAEDGDGSLEVWLGKSGRGGTRWRAVIEDFEGAGEYHAMIRPAATEVAWSGPRFRCQPVPPSRPLEPPGNGPGGG